MPYAGSDTLFLPIIMLFFGSTDSDIPIPHLTNHMTFIQLVFRVIDVSLVFNQETQKVFKSNQ
jgi:hypothetical protein